MFTELGFTGTRAKCARVPKGTELQQVADLLRHGLTARRADFPYAWTRGGGVERVCASLYTSTDQSSTAYICCCCCCY